MIVPGPTRRRSRLASNPPHRFNVRFDGTAVVALRRLHETYLEMQVVEQMILDLFHLNPRAYGEIHPRDDIDARLWVSPEIRGIPPIRVYYEIRGQEVIVWGLSERPPFGEGE